MSGVAHLTISGINPAASTTAATVWAVGSSSSYAQMLTGTALEAISDNAADASAGTGARTILINGLDSSYLPFSETVTLNGTTPVALANTSVVAINAARVVTAGSNNTNVGNISIRTVSGSTVKTRIYANVESVGRARDFIYTTSALVSGLLKRLQVYVRSSTGDVWVYLNAYNSSGVYSSLFSQSYSLDNTGFAAGPFPCDLGTGVYIPKQTLIELRVDVSAGTPIVNATGELELHAV